MRNVNMKTIAVILSTRWPFLTIGRREQLDLLTQPNLALFISTKNQTKRVKTLFL